MQSESTGKGLLIQFVRCAFCGQINISHPVKSPATMRKPVQHSSFVPVTVKLVGVVIMSD